MPLLKKNNTQMDVLGTTKYFVDIFGMGRYVYCLHSGSMDLSNLSTLLVLSWDDQLERRLDFDRSIKRIVINPSDGFLVALTSDESGTLDVVEYSI